MQKQLSNFEREEIALIKKEHPTWGMKKYHEIVEVLTLTRFFPVFPKGNITCICNKFCY